MPSCLEGKKTQTNKRQLEKREAVEGFPDHNELDFLLFLSLSLFSVFHTLRRCELSLNKV